MIGNMKPIRLVKYTTAQNETGRPVESIAATYNVWAELQKNGSGWIFQNGQAQLSNTMRFKFSIRGEFDLTGNWRLIWAGKEYTVQGIDRIDERKFNYQVTAQARGES